MAIKFEKIEYHYAMNTVFGFQALKGVDLTIDANSFTAIIGHTGSGKSTLVQHINALLVPTKGAVHVGDFSIESNKKNKNLKQLRKYAGLVFQFPEYQLFEDTVEKDIMFGPMNFGVSMEEARNIAQEVIQLVGLDTSFLSKSPFELSGGQKRRVAIAGILAMEPEVLILDEPTAGLDPKGTKEMMELFKKIHELGKTIILVTHDMNHVLAYCQDVVVMSQGEVLMHDSVSNVFSKEQFLKSLAIELPLITKMILALNEKGFSIDSSINTMEELALKIKEEIHG